MFIRFLAIAICAIVMSNCAYARNTQHSLRNKTETSSVLANFKNNTVKQCDESLVVENVEHKPSGNPIKKSFIKGMLITAGCVGGVIVGAYLGLMALFIIPALMHGA